MEQLFLKLVDRCIALIKRREFVDKSLYNEFVLPSFQDFERVHSNYIDGFRNYQTFICDESIPLTSNHPVLESIRNDTLFSHDIRSRLHSLRTLMADDVLGDFITSISRYMGTASVSPLEGFRTEADADYERLVRLGINNTIRQGFSNGLLQIFGNVYLPDPEVRMKALRLLEDSVVRINLSYEGVAREHLQLKVKLLKKR